MGAASIGSRLTLAAVVALAAFRAPAQTSNKADVDAVVAASQGLDSVLTARDASSAMTFWAHEDYVIKVHSDGKSIDVGWDAVRADYAELLGRFSEFSISTREPQVHVDQNVAWLVGVQTVKGVLKDGHNVTRVSFATDVYERKNGQWLLVAHMTGAVPR